MTDMADDAREQAGRLAPGGGLAHPRSLLAALRHASVAVLYRSVDGTYAWGENVPPQLADGRVDGLTDRDLFPAAVADRLADARDEVAAGQSTRAVDVELSDRWFSICVDADRDGNGSLRGHVHTLVDITDNKHREQTLRTLLREVSHRSRNLLAIIQSVAAQTGRHAMGMDDFLNRFRGRLQSMAFTQDLVTSSNWRGAWLRRLTIDQVRRYCADPDRNLRFDGPDLYLNPNAALHLGLGLHELAVNSVAHGALALSSGVVSISVAPSTDIAGAMTFAWEEPFASVDGLAGDHRFGSITLERVVPASMGGTATLSIADGRLRYTVMIPGDNYLPTEPTAASES